MRIAVIAHALRVAGGLAVGKNLIAAIGRVAPQHEYVITIPKGVGYEELCNAVPHCTLIAYEPRGGLIGRWAFDTYLLPRHVGAFKPNAILALANRGLVHPPCPQAILCQDAHLFYPPEDFGNVLLRERLVSWYQGRHLRRSLDSTQLLLCQTKVAERRLRAYLGYTGQIQLCPNAVSEFVEGHTCGVMVPPIVLPGGDRFLAITRYYPHKNLETLVETWDRYRDELGDAVLVLTIAADQHRDAARLLRRIERRGLSDRIVNIGPVSQVVLPQLYRACNAMILPTLLESFSGSYLEAMHFGVPILTSDRDFARGICGDAALYFDPETASSVRDAILFVKSQPSAAAELVDRGRRRLGMFGTSWDTITANVVAAVEEIARPSR